MSKAQRSSQVKAVRAARFSKVLSGLQEQQRLGLTECVSTPGCLAPTPASGVEPTPALAPTAGPTPEAMAAPDVDSVGVATVTTEPSVAQ
jgi:hypothetical protein